MKRWGKWCKKLSLLLGIAALLSPLLKAAQAPVQSKTGSLLLSGVVRRAGTGEPVAEAKVMLFGDMLPGERTARSDAAGRFTFPNLPEDRYTLYAERVGYMEQTIRCCDESKPGQGIGNVIVELTPTGIVSGVVVERGGNRLPLVPVQLLKQVAPSDVTGPAVVARTETNDRGEYRFHGVAPGSYYVSAGMVPESENSAGNVNFNGIAREVRDVYLRQFHPGEIDFRDALPITVSSGSEVPSVDFALMRQPLVRVRGTLVELQTGKPPAAANVYLKPMGSHRREADATASGLNDLSSPDYIAVRLLGDAYNAATGAFEVRRVFPGAYRVIAVGLGSGSPSAPNFGGYVSVSSAPISIGEADVDGVTLSLAPRGALVGRVTVEGQDAAPSPPAIPRIVLTPVMDDVAGDIPVLPSITLGSATGLQPDGTFRVVLLPVPYRLVIENSPSSYSVKEARFGGTDALKHPITISGLESGPLEIILARGRQ